MEGGRLQYSMQQQVVLVCSRCDVAEFGVGAHDRIMWLSAVCVLMVAFEAPVAVPGGMEGAQQQVFANMSVCSMWLSAVWVLMVAFWMPVQVPGGKEGDQALLMRIQRQR
jgi:hypothetical protein